MAQRDEGEPRRRPGDEVVRRVLRHLYERLPIADRGKPEPPPFPPVESAGADGLVAVGRELDADLVLEAYARGIFPMAEPPPDDDVIGWWSPDPRCVIPLDGLHVSRRLARTIRQGKFEVRFDTAFEAVMRGCARPEGTWISDDVLRTYLELHRRGLAHSVECWREGRLAGGTYGVRIGAAFMAESKFHVDRDASKVAVVALVERLNGRGFELLDVQYLTAHLARLGAVALPRREYLRRLAAAAKKSPRF
jgi:leucyl/phenylalanyl-tRNA--protein transferase